MRRIRRIAHAAPAAIAFLATALLAGGLAAPAARAATITIINADGAGEGFNDATPAAPVGGNPGTTVGAQRLYVFQYAANIWGGILSSAVTIQVNAKFDPLACTASSGVLGSAGAATITRDFPSAPFPGTWYHIALANKLVGSDLSPNPDINATFNSSVGTSGCLSVGWYYGVDGNEGGQIELLPVVLHELAHGLGFSTTTDGSTGNYASGFPGAYDHFLYDNTLGLHWNQMTATQRATSALNCARLVWDGPSVTAAAPGRLSFKPLLTVTAPAGIAGDFEVGTAAFGPALTTAGVTGPVVLVNDGTGTVTDGCEAIVGSLAGKIALIDRGTCTFPAKVKNAQNAGAIGVIIADNATGCPPAAMGGSDATITIPSVRVTLEDGNTLKASVGLGITATLLQSPTKLAGADAANHVMVYAPDVYMAGSSVSHFDVSAEPSLLMEPAITTGLSHDVDLTPNLFRDLGWFGGAAAVASPAAPGIRGLSHTTPNPTRSASTITFALAQTEHVNLGIYDFLGRQVARVAEGSMTAGTHSLRWDGRDRSGRPAAAGVYRCRLTTPSFTDSRSLVVVR